MKLSQLIAQLVKTMYDQGDFLISMPAIYCPKCKDGIAVTAKCGECGWTFDIPYRDDQ